MTIMLTALEREALDDCLTSYMAEAEGLDFSNGNPIVSRKAELELDLSTVAKRKFAIYIAATLEEMIEPDADSGWSAPKIRREACLRLASKIDAAVEAANGVEFTVSAEVPLPFVAQGCHTWTEEANAANHPITFPDVALGAVAATETSVAMVATAEGEPPMTDQALVDAVAISDEPPVAGRHDITPGAGAVVTTDGKSLTESSDLLRELETFLRERTVLPEDRFYYPLALWAAHTHCWQACQAELPYLNLTGPSGTGKNHTVKLVGSLSHNFRFVARATEAALRDLVNNESPTLGVAECESELRKHNSYVHILFNSGNVPGEPFRKILRGTSVEYDVYSPKMMATVGDVEPSLRSRCIVVPMSEGTPLIGDLEPAYERGRILGQRLHTLIEGRESEISNCYHRIVGSKTHERLVGRAWKIWLPLIAICEVLAPERLVELEHAATFCSSFKSRPLRSVKDMHALQADRELVVNCQRVVLDAALVLADYPGKNIATNDLIAKLLAMPQGWWVGYQCVDSEGRGIGIGDGESGRMTLAKMFKLAAGDMISPPAPHYISPGKTARGYIVAEVLAAARVLKGEGGNVDPDPGDEDSGQSGG